MLGMSSGSDRILPRKTKADRVLGAAAGAPLRAMASVAAIWILVRVISWYSPGGVVWYPVATVDAAPVLQPGKSGTKGWARLYLPVAGTPAPSRKSKRRYRFVHAAEPGPVPCPLPVHSAASVSRSRTLSGRYSDALGGFVLQASRRGPGGDSGEREAPIPRFPDPRQSQQEKKLAAYFWVHARQDSGARQDRQGTRGRSIANGQYGGSQAGAIFSYRLFDGPAPEILLYGRLSAALAPVSQEEIALGTRIRPVRNLPLAVHAEQRFNAGSGRASGMAFYATGGTGPDLIMERFALETYAQAGYVFGRNETYFFDGSATVQRPIADIDGRRLWAGAGLWAGGQRDIRRVDVGPRVSLDLPLGTSLTRIAVDARVRVAGNARPGSGAALTVSTSF